MAKLTKREKALQGKIAGVYVMPNTGQPGAGAARGSISSSARCVRATPLRGVR